MKYTRIEYKPKPFYNYYVGREDVFFQTKEFDLVRLSDNKTLEKNVSNALVTADFQYLVSSSGNKSFCFNLIEPNRAALELDFYVEAYCEYSKTFIGTHLKDNFDKDGLYKQPVDQDFMTSLNSFKEQLIDKRVRIHCLGKYIFFFYPALLFSQPTRLVFYDLDKGQIVADFSEEFRQLESTGAMNDQPFSFVGLRDDVLYISQGSSVEKRSPPRIIAVDIIKKEVKLIVEFSDQLKWLFYYNDNGVFATFSYLPMNMKYDKAGDQLIYLFGFQLFTYSLSNGEKKMSDFKEEFLAKGIFANNGASLYKDHLYFSSRVYVNNPVGRSHQKGAIGAFNLRTHKIDWHYHFADKEPGTILHTPYANDRYLVAHGSNNSFQVFEKQ